MSVFREKAKIEKFRKVIWEYYKKSGRKFPWRETRDPYHILVSEIMLQQTQTSRVEGKYEEFLKKFPNFRALARARTGDVLRAWQGLGYNRRALALKTIAEIVIEEYSGKLPSEEEKLKALPGIGPATAGAIRAFAFSLPSVFIETNIRRVFLCSFFSYKEKVDDTEVMKLITATVDKKNPREWYWALMDYGSALLTTSGSMLLTTGGAGKKRENPNRKSKHYTKQSKFAGSNRQLRGRILRILLNKKESAQNLARQTGRPLAEVKKVMASLNREGFEL